MLQFPLIGAVAAVTAAELPWIGEVQTPPALIPEDAPQLPSLLLDAQGQPVATPEVWRKRREAIRRWWLEFLGVDLASQCDLEPRLVHEDRHGDVVRQLVSLQVEPGCRMEAYLLFPATAGTDSPSADSGRKGVSPRLPGVVVFHSTSVHTIHQPAGFEDEGSHHLGLRLAEQGFVAVCPRNFIWNYCEPQPAYLDAVAELRRKHPGWRGMGKMLFDGVRAVDYLQSLPFVDSERIGCIGHSLGAKETLYLAAFDERVKAAVSSEGGIGLGFSNWQDPWYLGNDIRAEGFAHDHHEVLSLVAPRAFLLIGGEDADGSRSWPFIARGKEVYGLLGAGDRIGLLTHSSGHSLPPLALQCAYGWLGHFLAAQARDV